MDAISAELTPYHEHNAAAARPKLLQRIAEGHAVALVSDAGTPLISDPGFKLVREACAEGLAVTALPGPSSVMAALTYQTAFETELRAAVERRIKHLTEALITATAVVDYPDYRLQVGRIQAFMEIAGMCDEANDVLQKQARGEY